jgi:hypothetical protein
MKRLSIASIILIFVLFTGAWAQNVGYVCSGLWTEVEDIQASGNYIYGAFSNGLVILEVSNPLSPKFVSQLPVPGTSSIELFGGYAFLASYDSGLYVVDISNVSNPTILSHYTLPGMTVDIEIEGNYAYLQSNDPAPYFDFHIFDVSNPININHVSQTRFGGYPRSFCTHGDYAFVVGEGNGLLVLDISNRAAPESVYSYFDGGYMRGACVQGNYLYISDSRDGLVIRDISNPSNPIILGNCETPGRALTVTVLGDYAYIGDQLFGLQVLNIANPAAPTILGGCDTPGNATTVVLRDSLAFLADYHSIQVLDISAANAPYIRGNYFTGGSVRRIIGNGDVGYVLGISGSPRTYSLVSVDISQPSCLVPLQVFSDSMSNSTDYLLSGNHIYISEYLKGLLIVDISNPDSMKAVSLSCSLGTVNCIAKSGNFVYLGHQGITTVDVTDPITPVQLGTIETDYEAIRLFASGNYLFSCYFLYPSPAIGLRIYDISNPANPIFLGDYWHFRYGPSDIAVEGDYVYASTYDFERHGDIEIINISNPRLPVLARLYELPDEAYGIEIKEDLAYVATMEAGLVVADISIPDYPIQIGRFDSPGTAYDVSLLGDNILLADNSSLEILHFTRPDATGGQNSQPTDLALGQNYPNPFNASTTFNYTLHRGSKITLDIYDIQGRKIHTLKQGYMVAGSHQVVWNANDTPSGVYFYRLTAGENTSSNKMLLIK